MSSPARRPGPRTDLDVPDVIAATAERMFGGSGVDVVSLRAVAREAGVAPAALSYHFPTKDSLVAAVIARRGAAVGEATRAGLLPLTERSGEVSARDVVDAIMAPMVQLLDEDPVGGLHWLKVVNWSALTRSAPLYEDLAVEPGIEALFGLAVERALGERTRATRRRIGIAMFGLVTTLANADLRGYADAVGPDGIDPDFVETLAAYTAAGLCATV